MNAFFRRVISPFGKLGNVKIKRKISFFSSKYSIELIPQTLLVFQKRDEEGISGLRVSVGSKQEIRVRHFLLGPGALPSKVA